MRETRRDILENIKRRNTTTVHELAEQLEVSAVTIRHHLYALMADGLIQRMPIRQGVGRPQHGYSLTEAGQRRFPSRYHVLTTHLLSVLKHMESEESVQQLLETIVRQLFAMPAETDGLSPEMRLRQLEAHLRSNGIPIDITYEEDEEAHLTLSCPYHYVSQHHPELCSIDEKVLGDVLHMPLERTGCLLHGDKACTFSIKLIRNTEIG
jgi:predicted ArsR family transcriptional regulator